MPLAYDPRKPYRRLIAFADALGWHGLRMWQNRDTATVATWYATTDRKCFLQINEHPIGNESTYAAAVYASRYGICTGWHRFTLSDQQPELHLKDWLSRRHFRNLRLRRLFQLA